MKNLILFFLMLFSLQSNAQNRWFTTYKDSIALKNDAVKIISQFKEKVKSANPAIKPDNWKIIKNTSPYLIYIENKTINLPLWQEVVPEHKDFFTEVSGSKKDADKVFGLFFNGFYLVHEAGHGLGESIGKKFENAYDFEYDANTIAVLYWRSAGETKNLKKCYIYAKKMLKHLKNPVPENENFKDYMSKNYGELSKDPYKYGYIQFSQFVEIYENKSLPDFETFIRDYQQ